MEHVLPSAVAADKSAGINSKEPSNREENPLIGTQETFEVEGVEYTRTTEPGGNVRTSYEVDGVEYSSTTRENGSRSVFATENESDVNHSRTVEYDANGNLIEDKVQSSNGEIDPDTDEFHYQTRTETLTADGTRTTNEVGEVDGKACVLIDDMVDTAGTLCLAASALKANGAKVVVAYITHAVLSGPAISRINESELDEIVVTDTIPLSESAEACSKIRQLSTAELLAETMRRISDEESVSSLYVD